MQPRRWTFVRLIEAEAKEESSEIPSVSENLAETAEPNNSRHRAEWENHPLRFSKIKDEPRRRLYYELRRRLAGAHSWSAPMVSPPAMVPSAFQTSPFTTLLTERTDPSAARRFTPGGCRLDAVTTAWAL